MKKITTDTRTIYPTIYPKSYKKLYDFYGWETNDAEKIECIIVTTTVIEKEDL